MLKKICNFLDDYSYGLFGVLYVFLLLPYVFVSNVMPFLFSLCLIIYTVFMRCYKKKGVAFIIISLACIMPYVSNPLAQNLYDRVNGWIFFVIRVCCAINIILGIRMALVFYRKYFPVLGSVVLLFFINLILHLFYENEIKYFLLNYLSTFLFLQLCYCEKYNMRDLYVFFSLIFVFTFVYAVLEYHFHFCPYNVMYLAYFDENVNRAKGLMGHPLLLCAFGVFYFSFILIRSYLSKILNGKSFILFFMCLYLLLLTGSRTALFLFFGAFIFFIYLNIKLLRQKQIFSFLWLFSFICVLFIYMNMDKISFLFGRFTEGADHREAAFPTVWALFQENYWGVGPQNVAKKVYLYAKGGFHIDIETLDNTYLTFLAGYGVLMFFPLINYFFPFVYSLLLNRRKVVMIVFGILYVPVILLCFSFDVEYYMLLSLLYYGTSGFLIRILEKKRMPLWYKKNVLL